MAAEACSHCMPQAKARTGGSPRTQSNSRINGSVTIAKLVKRPFGEVEEYAARKRMAAHKDQCRRNRCRRRPPSSKCRVSIVANITSQIVSMNRYRIVQDIHEVIYETITTEFLEGVSSPIASHRSGQARVTKQRINRSRQLRGITHFKQI